MTAPNLFDPKLFRDASPFAKILLILFISFSSLLIVGFFFILLSIPIFHLSFSDLNLILKGEISSFNILYVKYFQATQSIALFIVPSILLNYLLFNRFKNYNRTPKSSFFLVFLMVIILMVFTVPITDKLTEWNEMIHFPGILESKFQSLEKEAGKITDQLLSGHSVYDLFINIIVIALIPAIGEEFFFRGIIQRLFYDWLKNYHFAVIFGAVLFSGIHLQFYGFIPRMMLGILFGYIFYWSKNIWLPVVGHLLNNTITILIVFFHDNNVAQIGKSEGNYLFGSSVVFLISIFLTVLMIISLRKILLRNIITLNQ